MGDMRGLEDELKQAWCRETSARPDTWTPSNPAWGQCAITALVVQDMLGGELLRGQWEGTSHYWNRLPSGLEVDLTRGQFLNPPNPAEVEERSREYVLSWPDTVRRYNLLKERMDSCRTQ